MRIAWAILFMGATLVVPMLVFGQVQLTELMSNPEGSDGDREWVEAINSGGALSVTTGRSGWRLSDGDNHLFKGENFTWQPNEIILFVQDTAKFRTEHQNVSNRLVESSFSLKNSGGTVKLTNEQGSTLVTASYGEGEESYSLINSNGSWVRGQKNGAPGIYPDTAAPVNPPPAQSSPQPTPTAPAPAVSTQSSGAASPPPPAQPTLPAEAFPPKAGAITPPPPAEVAPSLLISEFLPNTEGRDDSEFIELASTNSGEIKLDDIVVQVGEKKIKLTGAASGSFVTLKKQDHRFSIRNKGETITLFWKNKPIHKISYSGAAPAGRSFARINDQWVWTEPTPGTANVLIETASADKRKGAIELDELPLTAQVKNSERTTSLPSTILPTNFTPLLIGFASALLLSLAAVVFLK